MALRTLMRTFHLLKNNSNKSYINTYLKLNNKVLTNNNNLKLLTMLSEKNYNSNSDDITKNEMVIGLEEPDKKKKKKIFIPRVTLLSDKDEISIVTLEEAQKIAKRRNLHLIKIVDFDTKTERPVYKLMTIKDFVKAEGKCKEEAKELREKTIKEDKSIALSSKISIHDLSTKVKSMHRMMRKRHGVRILISIDGNKEKAETIRTYIIEKCEDIAKVINKSDTNTNLKLTLRPMLDKINEKSSEDDKETTTEISEKIAD